MATADIEINGTAASDDDLPINTVVNLSNNDDGDETTYLWEIIDQPPGTADSLSATDVENPTLTPQKEGTYLLQLTVDDGLATESIDRKLFRIRQLKSGNAILAAGEDQEDDAADGWAGRQNTTLREHDDAIRAGSVVAAVAKEALSAGNVVRFTSVETIKSGLPGAEELPGVTKALATDFSVVGTTLGVVLGKPGGAGSAVDTDVVLILVNGLYKPALTGAPSAINDPVYVNDVGELDLSPGNNQRPVGHVIEFGGGSYRIYVAGDTLNDITPDLNRNGFEDRSDSTISFTDGTRTFTIAPTGSDYYYWSNGFRWRSTGDTVVIPSTEGQHFIYYDGDTLTSTTTFTETLITQFAFVCSIYWDNDNSEAIIVADERHGDQMPPIVHLYNHLTFGTRYETGLDPTIPVLDGSGDEDIHAQISFEGGTIWDEDIRYQIVDGSPQVLSPVAQIPVYYREGANNWRRQAANDFPVIRSGSNPDDLLVWNDENGGDWTLTTVTNNDYLWIHFFAIQDINNPIIAILGQNEYNSEPLATDAAPLELKNISYGVLSSLAVEFLPICSVLIQTATFKDNAVAASWETCEDQLGNDADFLDHRKPRGGQILPFG